MAFLIGLGPADDDLEPVFGSLQVGDVERHQLRPTKRACEAQQQQRTVA
jgi:hypothetical protein